MGDERTGEESRGEKKTGTSFFRAVVQREV